MKIHERLILGMVAMLLSVGVEASEWVRKYNKEGIEVFTRQVQGSDFLEFRGEVTVTQSLSTIMSLLWAVEDMPQWMFGCESSRLVSSKGGFERELYLVNEAPFPLKKRDLVMSNKVTQDAQTLAVHYTMHLSNTPVKSEYVRVAKMDGFLDLIPQGVGKTKVVYQAHIEAGGAVPSWAANMFAVDNPINTLKGMRQIMSKKTYSSYPGIVDQQLSAVGQ